MKVRACIWSAILSLSIPLSTVCAQQVPEPPGEQELIYYDYVEGGVLSGGVVEVDPANPLMKYQGAPTAPTSSSCTTLIWNGPPERRIDLVLVGDGYTSAEMGDYAEDVDSVLLNFFSKHPLDKYQSFFNVHRVDVISNDSGVDHDPVQGVLKDTALDMGFWCNGTERLLCVNLFKAYSQAGFAPEFDTILALANSSKYGGAGYTTADVATLAAANSSTVQIAIHEFGHSFADLADEYSYGGPTTYTGPEPSAANVSIYEAATMASLQTKWFLWLSHPAVDTFEGAYYSRFGIYRPLWNTQMRNLGLPFGVVNAEQFILKFYERVLPIDDATPPGLYSHGATFFVDPVDPVGHALDVQWSLDGTPISWATGSSLDTSSLVLSSGAHTISVEVVDNTDYVRDELKRYLYMREVRSWTIDDGALVLPYGCGVNPADSISVISGLPQIGATVILGLDNPWYSSGPGSIPILAISMAPDSSFPCGTLIPGMGMPVIWPGELLISLQPTDLIPPLRIGSPYGGPGSAPAPVSVRIPNDPRLLGLSVYAQGLLFDPTGSYGCRMGLSDAVELRIGY